MSEYIGVFIIVFLAVCIAVWLAPPTGKFALPAN